MLLNMCHLRLTFVVNCDVTSIVEDADFHHD